MNFARLLSMMVSSTLYFSSSRLARKSFLVAQNSPTYVTITFNMHMGALFAHISRSIYYQTCLRRVPWLPHASHGGGQYWLDSQGARRPLELFKYHHCFKDTMRVNAVFYMNATLPVVSRSRSMFSQLRYKAA